MGSDGYCDPQAKADENNAHGSSPRKRRSAVAPPSYSAPKRKPIEEKIVENPKTNVRGWFAMLANEENAAKGKCSYSRYNFYLKVNFGKKNKNGKPFGFVDDALQERLTPDRCEVGKQIYYWCPYQETKSRDDDSQDEEKKDNDAETDKYLFPGHYRRATLVKQTESSVEEKEESEKLSEGLEKLFGSEAVNSEEKLNQAKEVLLKMLNEAGTGKYKHYTQSYAEQYALMEKRKSKNVPTAERIKAASLKAAFSVPFFKLESEGKENIPGSMNLN